MQSDEMPLSPREQLYRAFLISWVKNAWESRASASVEDYFHPECVVTGMVPVVLEGVDQVQTAYQALHARVSHCHADISHLLMRGEQYSLVMELQGVHQESGLEIVIEVAVFGSIKDDLVFRSHNVVDYTGMYAKLGMLNVDMLRNEFG